ncbi:MAG: ArgE/DapE family deacylase [Rhizobiales bacterium]|nr:ArgE/DapE family deacylase [Hyphomicrobiales bacterium]
MSLEKTISEAVEARADRIVETLKDLVSFESVSRPDPAPAGPGEAPCQQYLKGRLEALGFATELWEPDPAPLLDKYRGRPGAIEDRTFDRRPNLAGRLKGQGGGRSILLTGHVDVVPTGPIEHWKTDPFKPVVTNDAVYGRGTVDMKGGVAAMLMAVETLSDIGVKLKGDVVFSTVADEEICSMGALALADRGYTADAGIMTEPTDNRIAPLCYGIVWGRIVIDGIGGHAELSPRNWNQGGPVDAIELCRQILDGIDLLNRRWQYDPRKNHPLMEWPARIVATQIRAGEHPSSYAGRAEIVFDAKYLPAERDALGRGSLVKAEIEAHLAAVCAADPYLRQRPARIEWMLDADCTEVPSDHPFVTVLGSAVADVGLSTALTGFSSHSDIGIPTEIGGTPTVNFGPGDPSQAHQPNERVAIADLVACTEAIALAVARWCA